MLNMKNGHLSKQGENSEEAIKSKIIEQCENFLKQMPIELRETLPKKLPSQIKGECKFFSKEFKQFASFRKLNKCLKRKIVAFISVQNLSLSKEKPKKNPTNN